MGQLRVGINGLGRIGRLLLKEGFLRGVKIVGVNDLASTKTIAHLLKYDSTHGVWKAPISFSESTLHIDNKDIPISQKKDPSHIPWKSWQADIVLECTGVFKIRKDLEKHLQAGGKKVIISAPSDAVDQMIVVGVNENSYDPKSHNLLSNASCTTNCLAPLVKVLHESFGIKRGLMTTVHSITNDQRILDSAHLDLRRARGAFSSIIPTTTGAARCVGSVLPEMKGKIDGLAVRVPTTNVSLVDFVFTSEKNLNLLDINGVLKKASQTTMKGILACEKAPLTSIDFTGNTHSSIIDTDSTMVIENKMAKVLSWYDNEIGFSHRMIDLAHYVAKESF